MSDAQDAVRGAGETNGWRSVPDAVNDDWAYQMALNRQGQSETPRCEGPTARDIGWAADRIAEVLAAAPVPPIDQDSVLRIARVAREARDRVCHDDQMVVWTGEIAGALSMGDYLRDDLSYDDNVSLHAGLAQEVRRIIESAFSHPEIAATAHRPADPVKGGDAERLQEAQIQGVIHAMRVQMAHSCPDAVTARIYATEFVKAVRDATRSDRGGTDTVEPFFDQDAIVRADAKYRASLPPPVSPAPVGIGVEEIADVIDPIAVRLGNVDYYGPDPDLQSYGARKRVAFRAARAIIARINAPVAAGGDQWRPIRECRPDVTKIIGWCTFYAGAEARFCSRYIYGESVGHWQAHGVIQTITHFKPWPEEGPPAPSPVTLGSGSQSDGEA